MKIVVCLFLIFMMSFSASAHPGKTDYRGGHKCWKNCDEWELGRGEYHMHDNEGKPIRLDQRGNIPETAQDREVPTPEKHFLLEVLSEQASRPEAAADKGTDQPVIVEKHHVINVYEESILPVNSILLIILALLMLIVLIFVRKKKEKE